MKKILICFLTFLFLCGSSMFIACSQSNEEYAEDSEYYEEDDRSVIDKINKRTADKAVDYIQTPINKAKGVRDKASRHVEDLEGSTE